MQTIEQRYQERKLQRVIRRNQKISWKNKLSKFVINTFFVLVSILSIIGFMTAIDFIAPPVHVVEDVRQP